MAITHLNLNQTTSSIEVVSSTIIDKLYELAKTNLDETSNVQGNLQVVHAYEDAVTYLLNKFPNLQINVTGGAYIRFADNAVATICAKNWGDGIGTSLVQASIVNTLNNKFSGNTNIISFNEFSKFINVKILLANEFQYCSKLTTIDLSNITTIGGSVFEGCTALTSILNINDAITALPSFAFAACKNLSAMHIPVSCTTLGDQTFKNDAKLAVIDSLANIVSIGNYCFSGCTSITTLDFSNALKTIGDSAFKECGFTTITIPSTVTSIGGSAFEQNNVYASTRWAKCLAVTPPADCDRFTFTSKATYKIYVPDDSVDAYKAATNWSTYISRIFSLTQFAIDFPNG